MRVLAMTAALFGSLGAAASAGDFVPCRHNRAGDAGLRVLVEAVERSSATTLAVQQRLGRKPTPLQGSAADVDELAWCRCLHRKRAEALGEELAAAMAALDPREAEKYERWLFALTPERQREHGARHVVDPDLLHARAVDERALGVERVEA